MFASYDMDKFSYELKKLRISMGFTIDNVYTKTGISKSTIKLLENGSSVPKFETLQILSHFYKTDLILTLNKYKNSWQVSSLYDKLNSYMACGNKELLRAALAESNQLLLSSDFQPVIFNDILQLKLLFEGLEIAICCLESTHTLLDQAIEKICSSLKVSNSGFEIDSFNEFKYNATEYTILFSLASLLGMQRKCELSNRILDHILDYLDYSCQIHRNDLLLKSKTLSIIAYNYHRIDNHEKVVYYANIGIQFSLENDTYEYLPLLLVRKSTALYNLEEKDWQVYFQNALNLLEIQGKAELKSSYEKILSKMINKVPS